MATDNTIRSIEDRLLVIETTLKGHNDRFNTIDARLNGIDGRLTSIENRLTLILVSTLAAVFAGFGGLIAAVFFR